MASDRVRVSLLDVGPREYGDAVLLQFGATSVMIDGAHVGRDKGDATHPSIPDQLGRLLDQTGPPYTVDLLIVSHTHQDHVGCLPDLVHKDLLRCRWALMSHPGASFGRAPGEPSPIDGVDEKVRAVLAGLREEAPHPATTDLELLAMLDAAASLETRYNKMLRELDAAGTQVVVPADPTGTEVAALLAEFDGLGLTILGPTPALLAATAERIRGAMDGMIDAVVEMAGVDARASKTDLFRSLLGPTFDGLDARDRPGNLVNLQSYTTTFEFSGVKLLLAGDMQFSDPQSGDDDIDDAIDELRADVAAQAPYSFVKLSHHGSGNGFDAQILEEMGTTKLYGISAGAHSSHHPDPVVLDLLESQKRRLSWVRSDRNGLTTISFSKGRSRIRTSRGRKNDPQPNEIDTGTTPAESEIVGVPGITSHTVVAEGQVEVITRLPHAPTTVRVTIEVDPEQVTARTERIQQATTAVGDFKLGAGRELPKLLFATNIEALGGNVGELEAGAVVEAIRSSGQTMFELPPPSHDPSAALSEMKSALKDHPDTAGVVLIGGYNVVPSTRIDCIPDDIRSKLGVTGDPDNFVVWSDDAFGDSDDDQFPELPVSRIPDGRDSQLLLSAISAAPGQPSSFRSGIRNVHRPFATDIYSSLSGDREFLVSEPYVFEAGSSAGVDGSLVYFMLHGDWNDSSRFWGEDTGGIEAVNVGNVPPDMDGATVFGGCCWGALTVDTPANKVVLGRPFGQKTPNASMALSVLRRGALAYVGCTGAHYSPVDAPYDYFGGPMHRSFWKGIGEGRGPAQALFDAKAEYAAEMPHGMNRPLEVAIEYKTLRQFSCLGLGW